MAEYQIRGRRLTLVGNPSENRYEISTGSGKWVMSDTPCILFSDGSKVDFPMPQSEGMIKNGTSEGITALYVGFEGHENITVRTTAYIEMFTDDVYFTLQVNGDRKGEIRFVKFPVGFDYGTEYGDRAALTSKNLPESYTVLPLMQGAIVPAGTKIDNVRIARVFTNHCSMAFFGQVRKDNGYLAIYDTPYDGLYELQYETGEKIAPMWCTQLGGMNYPRRILYRFLSGCDYNDIAAAYRIYVKSIGKLVTLKEKIIRNPNIARLLGCPIIHEEIAGHVQKESSRYRPNEPEWNDRCVPFGVRAQQLRELHAKGLKKAYTHFDGWCRRGYDNQHPDVFPPNEEAGGIEGMKELADTTISLGYIFGVHDQYRDYYLDADTFSGDNAALRADGTYPIKPYWDGGKHTYLCPSLARDYVRRNYNTFEEMGIRVEAAYLDVFAIAEMDQCFNPAHPVNREQCCNYRRECLDMLNAKGIIPSSETITDCILPSMCLCHHAPHHSGGEYGIEIPLLNLVYHDCVVTPWMGRKYKDAWHKSGYARAWLHGNPLYLSITADEEEIAEITAVCRNAEKLALQRMMRHEILSPDGNVQRTVFEDGTVIEANLATYEVSVH